MENNFTEDSESYIQHDPHRTNFTTIYNDCINDRQLEHKDLGLLLYMISKPPLWKIRIKELCNRFDIGEESLRKQLNKLKELGYIKRKQNRNEDGSWGDIVTYVNDKPIYKDNKQPHTEKPCTVNTGHGKTEPLVKKEVQEKKELIKKETSNTVSTNTARACEEPSSPINAVGNQTSSLIGNKEATRKMIDDALKRGRLDRLALDSKKHQSKTSSTTLQEHSRDE